MNVVLFSLIFITKVALSNTISPDVCFSQSLKSCTIGGHECGYLGGMKDINGNYYSNQVCEVGFINGGGCVCDNLEGYNYYTCLPDINGCTMCNGSPQLVDLDTTPPIYPGYIAYNSGGYSMYYCMNQDNEYSTLTNEIRVIGAHAQATGQLTVNLRTCAGMSDLSKPIKLLLTSYNQNYWVIKSDDQYVIDNINIIEIQLWSYENTLSTVTIDSSLLSRVTVTPQIRYASGSTLGYGYGSDSGGGSTATLLNNVPSELGDFAYSYVGQYETDAIEACVGNQGNIGAFDIFEAVITPTTTKAATTDTVTTNSVTTAATTTTTVNTDSNSGTISPETCHSDSLKACTGSSNYCGSLEDINGNYKSPVCNFNYEPDACVCDSVDGYNYFTCLPDINGCTMCSASSLLLDLDKSPAEYPGYMQSSMYYCLNQDNDYSTFNNEIRVVGCYESSNGDTWNHISGVSTINLRTCSGLQDLSKPIKLLLTSYEPVDWIIKSDDQYVIDNINVIDIQVWSYYSADSTVTIDSSLSSRVTVTPQMRYATGSTLGFGYGSDSGGGSTAKMLNGVPTELGDFAYSFVGQYSIDNVQVCVGNQGDINTFEIVDENNGNPTTTDAATTDTATTNIVTANTGSISPETCCSDSLKSCMGTSNYCGSLKDINGNYKSPVCNFDYEPDACVCDGIDGYNYFTCLPDINGCTMCNASPTLSDLDTTPAIYPGHIPYDNGGYSMYYCLNQDNDYSTFNNEIRVVGCYESSNGVSTINLRTCSGLQDLTKPIKLLLTSYEPVDWTIKSDDQYVIDNINIVDIQVWSYYSADSTVTIDSSLLSSVTITPQMRYATGSTLGFGYGSDLGGSSVAKLLSNTPMELGDFAYSFVGQYSIDNVQVCVGNQGDINIFEIGEENNADPTTTNVAATKADRTDSETTTNDDTTSTTEQGGPPCVFNCDSNSAKNIGKCTKIGIIFAFFVAIFIG